MNSEQISTSTSQKGKSSSSIDTTRKTSQELGIHRMLQEAFADMEEENPDMKTLLPISILLEEMKSDHSSTRMYCLQNLSTIALVLGPARAKGLLGGFISNLLKDQEQAVEDYPEELQVMLTLLESMPKLINLIGGPENSLVLLQSLLDTISDRTKDETKNMYIKVMREIGRRLQKQQNLFEDCVTQRIVEAKEGKYEEQCAAVTFIANLYNLVSKKVLQEWMEYFKQLMLSNDQNVRKRVVLSLKEFGQWASNQEEQNFVIQLADDIYTNGKDFKSNLFYCLPQIVKFQGNQDFVNKLFKMENMNAYNCFLEVFIESLQIIQNMPDSKQLIEQFIRLLSKSELELKQKLATQCGRLVVFIKESKTIYKGYLVQIQQYLTQLDQEKNFLIKQNLVDSMILILTQATDRRIYYQQEEIQFFIRFLVNQLINGDSDLKFKFIQKLKSFNIIMQFIQDNAFTSDESNQILKSLLQIIISLEACKGWRMRQQCLFSLQMFFLNLKQFQLFKSFQSEDLEVEILKKMLQDTISAVREESSKTLQQLFKLLKENGQIEKGKRVLEIMKDLLQHQNYLVRVQFVLGLGSAYFLGENTFNILRGLKNEVPNVKLALLETIYNNKQHKMIELLPLNDADQDVRDVAQLIYLQFK